MSDKNKLGRGLGAIFGDDVEAVLEEIQKGQHDSFVSDRSKVSVDAIRTNPYQPRKQFDQSKLIELANSIKEHGIVTPIIIRKSEPGYELIAGERRLRAAKLAELEQIDAIVMDFSDEQMMEISLIENIQRENLNIMEEAMAYEQMVTRFGYTQEALSKKVGKSREHITNILRLNRLPKEVAQLVMNEQLTMGHVRPLIPYINELDVVAIAHKIVKDDLSVRSVEALLKKPAAKPKVVKDYAQFAYASDLLEQKVQSKVSIDDKKITIHYHSMDDLNRILEALGIIESD